MESFADFWRAATQQWVEHDDLPPEAQKAVHVYMLDGLDTGGFDNEAQMEAHKRKLQYRLEQVPTEEMKRQIMTGHSDIPADHPDFDSYHQWYTSPEHTEKERDRNGLPRFRQHTERWPVIADDFYGDVIDDGWHRFHSYVAQGDSHIPVLHVRRKDLTAEAAQAYSTTNNPGRSSHGRAEAGKGKPRRAQPGDAQDAQEAPRQPQQEQVGQPRRGDGSGVSPSPQEEVTLRWHEDAKPEFAALAKAFPEAAAKVAKPRPEGGFEPGDLAKLLASGGSHKTTEVIRSLTDKPRWLSTRLSKKHRLIHRMNGGVLEIGGVTPHDYKGIYKRLSAVTFPGKVHEQLPLHPDLSHGMDEWGLYKGNPQLPLYRGVQLPHPPDMEDVRDHLGQSHEQDQAIARHFVEHAVQGNSTRGHRHGLGIHWSHDQDATEDLANQAHRDDWGGLGDHGHAVMLEADHPGHEHVIDFSDPMADVGGGRPDQPSRDWHLINDTVGPHHMLNAMLPEVPIRPGAPMHLRAIHVQKHDGSFHRIPVGLHTQAGKQTYYHGSDHEFEPGDIIQPGGPHGLGRAWSVDSPHYTPEYVYHSTDHLQGMEFGRHVYEVEPLTPVEVDPEDQHTGWTRNRGQARVIRKVIENNRRVGRVLTDWQPTDRLFAPTKAELDPRLFSGKQMLPEVRSVLMEKMDNFMSRFGGPDWTTWARMYLAGSEASLWWGNNDFDILVGVNYDGFRQATGSDESDAEITSGFNAAFKAHWNDEQWHPPFRPDEEWHLTGYVNPDSWDIRNIKPYAAYEVVSQTWFVEPINEPTGHHFDPSFYYLAEGYAEQIKHILQLPEPERTIQGTELWHFLHSDRARAFGPTGEGAFDRGNAIEKYLDQDPGPEGVSLWQSLVNLRYGKTAKTAVQTPPDDLYFEHTDVQTGGSKYPTLRYLYAKGADETHYGLLRYYPPRRSNGIVKIDRLDVHPECRRMGVGSALMDEVQRRHPDSTINHGDRTDDGKAWWAGYTEDKQVHRGRTGAIKLRCSGCGEDYFTDGEAHGCTMEKSAAQKHYPATDEHPYEYHVSSLRDPSGNRLEGGSGDAYVVAHHEGEPIGFLRWNFLEEPPRVQDVSVDEPHQRKGVATRLWEIAREHESRLEHSDTRTPAGKDWINSLGAVHYPAEGPNGDEPDGIMIALVPPLKHIEPLIPEDGEHPSNMHVTLAYLGKIEDHSEEQVDNLPELIEAWAEGQQPIDGHIQGVGTFVNTDNPNENERHVLWAGADLPGAPQMYVSLMDYLKGHGYKPKENHGFVPHITLAYGKHHFRFLPKLEERKAWPVREVWLCIGPRWESFRLGSVGS